MIIEMLMAHRPGLGERLERLREDKPEEFDAMIRRNTPHFLRMVEEKRRDPEMFKLRRELVEREFEVRRLARQIRESGQPATPEQKQQIKAAVERQFEARLQIETQAIAHLRAEAEKVEQRRQKLEQERGQLIEKGVTDALEGRKPDRPEPPEGAPPPPPGERP
jgi:anion-transporting  ArsA/GET3 family ATPase